MPVLHWWYMHVERPLSDARWNLGYYLRPSVFLPTKDPDHAHVRMWRWSRYAIAFRETRALGIQHIGHNVPHVDRYMFGLLWQLDRNDGRLPSQYEPG